MIAFSDACALLRSHGFDVTPADIPGLTYVNGVELTMGQVINLVLSQIIKDIRPQLNTLN